MSSFSALEKLLSKLPFSIIGRHDIYEEIDDFFVHLRGSPFINGNKKINLVSYSFAKLTDPDEWKTDSFSSNFFFYSLNERFSSLSLNVYYGLRDKLFAEIDSKVTFEVAPEEEKYNPSNSVAIILSRLFIRDTSFRLRFVPGDEWLFGYLESWNTFSIKMPLSRVFKGVDPEAEFRKALGIFILKAEKKVAAQGSLDGLILQKGKNIKDSLYAKNLDLKKAEYLLEEEFSEFLEIFKERTDLEALRDEMIDGIMLWHYSNPGFFVQEDTREIVSNWVELFFQILFVSLVYKSWVEYFTSPCGTQLKRNANSLYEEWERNLGGLIIGYKLEDQITSEERSVFKLISARISASIASQWTLILNNKRQTTIFRRRFVDFAGALAGVGDLRHVFQGHSDFLHGLESCDVAFKELTVLVESFVPIIGEDFRHWVVDQENRFSKYLTVVFNPAKETCAFGVPTANVLWQDTKKHYLQSCPDLCVYCRLKKVKSDKANYFFNLPLMDALIKKFESGNETVRNTETPLSTKEERVEENGRVETFFSVSFNYQHEFRFENFFSSLYAYTTGGFCEFLVKNKIPILAMGNLRILDTYGNEKFNFEKWHENRTSLTSSDVIEGFSLAIDLKNKI